MTNYLLAGGGTAGHVNPLLALADYIRSQEPDSKIICLGTAEGLESRLIPQRGYELSVIARLPFPRRLGMYALKFPLAYARELAKVRKLIRDNQIDVVVGFGGYASAPAYDAAAALSVPFVVHEANALPGMANLRGSKKAAAVAVAFPTRKLAGATHVGMPLRVEIENLPRNHSAAEARKHFGLKPDAFTLLVTGGSLGAKRINDTIEKSRTALSAAGVQVLHIVGDRSDLEPVSQSDYVRIRYCDRMDLAIAAADFAVARAGASTISEFAAVGLAAAYVPYAVGNGEQALNVSSLIEAEASIMVKDAEFTPAWVSEKLIPVLSNAKLISAMRGKLADLGIIDGSKRLYEVVRGVLKP